MNSILEMQNPNVDILLRNNGFIFTDTFIPYVSGKIGPYKIATKNLVGNGDDFVKVVDSMNSLLSFDDKEYIISGGESSDWPFSLVLAYTRRKSHSFLYKDGSIGGANINGKKVIHVADVNNEGYSISLWARIIKENGGDLVKSLFYVDRNESGVGVVKSLGIESGSVLLINNSVFDYIKKNASNIFDENQYLSVMRYMEDRESWATRMLKSDAGLETLIKLLNGGVKEKERAKNIIERGYPSMKTDLVNRLGGKGFSYISS